VCSRLRRLPAELLRFPPRALEVRVSGFGPPSGGGEEEEAVLSYSPGWSLKATMDMLHMLHGDITAAIVVSALTHNAQPMTIQDRESGTCCC